MRRTITSDLVVTLMADSMEYDEGFEVEGEELLDRADATLCDHRNAMR